MVSTAYGQILIPLLEGELPMHDSPEIYVFFRFFVAFFIIKKPLGAPGTEP